MRVLTRLNVATLVVRKFQFYEKSTFRAVSLHCLQLLLSACMLAVMERERLLLGASMWAVMEREAEDRLVEDEIIEDAKDLTVTKKEVTLLNMVAVL